MPVFDASGQLTGYRDVDKNIAEQKAMDDLLMRTQKMDALGKLTGNMAHDFNNMLGTIMGSAERHCKMPYLISAIMPCMPLLILERLT